MPSLKFDVLQLDSAPVWVKLWHVPLELFSRQGLGYVASAIAKPLYTDRVTALKQQLEFSKICIEVGAKETIPNSVLVELDEDLTVEIAVELVWSPPRCGHCSIFGHSKDNYSKEKVVEDGVAKVDGGPENNCDATVDDGRVNNGDSKEGLSCDADGSLGVDSHVSSMVEMSSPNGGIPCVISGESLESPNKFEILCSVVEGQDGRVVSPRKVRAAAGGVADLMNQLKGKVKDVKEPKGPKKKNQGKGGQKPVPDTLLRDILGVELYIEMHESLVAPVTLKEIKDVVFAMNGRNCTGCWTTSVHRRAKTKTAISHLKEEGPTDAPRGRFGAQSYGRGGANDRSERYYSRLRGNGFYRPTTRRDRGLSGQQVSKIGQSS
ncbi:hypothetical protein V6N13_091219 [Hibiscus sabdariffa]